MMVSSHLQEVSMSGGSWVGLILWSGDLTYVGYMAFERRQEDKLLFSFEWKSAEL